MAFRNPAKAGEKREALRKILLSGETSRQSESAKKAITFCEIYINEYEEWFVWNDARWTLWQIVVIVGGVIATLAGVITLPDEWVSPAMKSLSWLRGVPAGIVTIAAGFLASFTYREDAVRQEMTAASLWIELAKFQTHAEPYNKTESDDTSAFVIAISQLIDSELRGWSALMGSKTESERVVERPKSQAPRDGEQPESQPSKGGEHRT
jgi:hypothetical protein